MDLKGGAAAAPGEASSKLLRVTLKPLVECLFVASQLAMAFYCVWEEPRRLQLLASIALCYAVVVALTLFARRLDASSPEDRRSGKGRWMKLGARVLASLVINVLSWRTKSMMPVMLLVAFVFGGDS